MKSLQILLNALGIKIDPAQIETAFEHGKDALPKLVKAFEEILANQKVLSDKLDNLSSQIHQLSQRTD